MKPTKPLGVMAVLVLAAALPGAAGAMVPADPSAPPIPLFVDALYNTGGQTGFTDFTCGADAAPGCGAQEPGGGNYQIGFNIPPDLANAPQLQAGDTITFRAPPGVAFPSDPSDYTVGSGSGPEQVCQDGAVNCVTVARKCFDTGSAWITDVEGDVPMTVNNQPYQVPEGCPVHTTLSPGEVSVSQVSPNVVTVTLPPDFVTQSQGDPADVLQVSAVGNPPAGSYTQFQFTVSASDSTGTQIYGPGWATNGLSFDHSGPVEQNSLLEVSSQTTPVSLENGVGVTATIRDQFGNPVPGDQVVIEALNGNATPLSDPGGAPSTGNDGTESVDFVDTIAQEVSFEADDGNFVLFQEPSVTFTPGAPVAANSLVRVASCPQQSCPPNPSVVSTDGGSALVTVELADQFGNPTVQPVTREGDEVALEPTGAGEFAHGTIVPAPRTDSDCTQSSGPPISGLGCTNTVTVANTGQAQFEVSDTTAEDVQFAVDDLTTGTILDDPPSQSPPSPGMRFTIDFVAGAPAAGTADDPESTVGPSTQQVGADGQATGRITVTLKDDNGNPVPDYQVSLAPSAASSATVTPVQTTGSGCANQPAAGTSDCNGQTAFAVSDTALEQVAFTASYSGASAGSPVSGSVPGSAVVQFVAGAASPSSSTVTASRSSLLDDGMQSSTITVTLVDSAGHPAAGRAVSLAGSSGTNSQIAPLLIADSSSGCSGSQAPAGTTDCTGTAEFSVTDASPESVTYTATDSTDATTIDQRPTVTFTPPPSPDASTMVASPPTVAADGTSTSTISVTLADGSGKPLGGKQLCLTQTKSAAPVDDCSTQGASSPSTIVPETIPGASCAGPTAPAETTDCHGQARFTVTTTSPAAVTYGVVDVSDYSDSGPLLGPFATVTFTRAPSEAGQSTVTATPSAVLAGASGATGTAAVTVTLEDAAGSPIADHAVRLTGGGSASITPVASSASGCATPVAAGTTDCDGQAVFDVTDGTPRTVSFTATDTTASPPVAVFEQATVAFLPDEAATSTVVASPTAVSADGGATPDGVSVVTVTADPEMPSAAAGDDLSISASGGHSTIVARSIPEASSGCHDQASPGTADCHGQAQFAVSDATPQTVSYVATDDSTGVAIAARASVTFRPASPVVYGIRPASGPLAGGNRVRISGRELTIGSGAPVIRFGRKRAAKVTCPSSSSCTALAPAGVAVGSVEVMLSTSAGSSSPGSPGADTYRYRGPHPVVTRIAPSRGPSSGGTVVTVLGSGLGAVGETKVEFGTAKVSPLSVNARERKLTVRAPAEVGGTVAVTVTTPYGVSHRRARARFTYYVAQPHRRRHR